MTEPKHRRGKTDPTDRADLVEPQPLTARELNRSARRDANARARRKILLATLAAIAIVAIAVVASWIALRPDPARPNEVQLPQSTGASALLVVTDAEGRAQSILLLAAADDVADRAMLFQPSLVLTVPGFGDHELGDVPALGDDLVGLALTNLLGIRVDGTVVLDAETFASAIAEPLEVDLPAPLLAQDGDVERVLASDGPGLRNPELLATLLTEPGLESESGFLLRQARVWAAVLEAVASDGAVADRLLASATPLAAQAVNGAAQDPDVVLSQLPVDRLESFGSGTEQFGFDGATTATLVDRAFPYLAITIEPRVVVEVLNGNGGVGVTQPVARRLVEAGYHVIRTDNADREDYGATQIIAQGREAQQAALAARDLLGRGEVLLELRQPSGIFDLTIIVGND